MIVILFLLTACADWTEQQAYVEPPSIDMPSSQDGIHAVALDGDALLDRVAIEAPFDVRSLILRATLPEDARIDVQIEGVWQEVVFAEQLGSFRTIDLEVPAVRDLAFRSTQPADFFQVELFESETPRFDDHVGHVPEAPNGDSVLDGGPMQDSTPGRWYPSHEAWMVGQEQNVAYEGFDACSGAEEPGARMLGNFLVEHFGASHVEIYNCRLIGSGPNWSLHGTGRAIDVRIPPVSGEADNDLGDPIAHFLMENADRIGLQFIIWDRSDWMAARGGDKHEYYSGGHPHHDHLHIELNDAGARMETPFFTDGMPAPGHDPFLSGGDIVDIASTASGDGYWTVRADGTVYAHGDAVHHGDASSEDLVGLVQGIAPTPSGNGYWLVAMDGGVFSYGDADFFGSMGGQFMVAPVVDMAPTRSGNGYWLVGMDGGVFSFGDADFHGSAADLPLMRPVVGIAADPGGDGYWLAAADGGVFTFGDIEFPGSMAGEGYEVVDIAADPDGEGVWLTAMTGEVFDLGGAPWHGGAQDLDLVAPVYGIAPLPNGLGYWQVALDGGVFTHGAAHFYGADN